MAIAFGRGPRDDLVAVAQLDACYLAAPEAPEGGRGPRTLRLPVWRAAGPAILNACNAVGDACWEPCVDKDEGEVAEFGRVYASELARHYR